jgi:hypothetical protein
MNFPATHADMLRAGYVFLATKDCANCHELIHFFRTPRGKRAPFVKTPRGRFVSHFFTCASPKVHHQEERKSAPQLELFPF